MKSSAQSVNGGTLQADVAIVGAGPAGLTVARELAHAGLDVVLLESGTEKRNGDSNRLNRGASSGYPFPLATSRNRSFGGTSAVWRDTTGLRVRPLDPMDLEANAISGAPGWPISNDELQPYYKAALEDLGLPVTFEPADWSVPDSHPLASSSRMFMFGPSDRFVSMRGEVERAARIHLVLDATVTAIEGGIEGREVSGLTVRSRSGSAFRVQSKVFVLASGGIENPRILLASRQTHPEGVANRSDMVGRFFMDHVSQDVAYLPTSVGGFDLDPFQERTARGNVKTQAMFALPPSEIRDRGLMNAALWIAPVSAAEMTPAVRAVRALRYSIGARPLDSSTLKRVGLAVRSPRALVRYVRSRRNGAPSEVIAFRIMAEQAPRAASRVTLGARTDALGVPEVRLDWQVSETDRQSLLGHVQGLSETFTRLGLGTVAVPDDLDRELLVANHHHLGTTRMHNDPKLGVVDSDCRSHGVRNLYIAGSSVFPTGGYVNPTLTILALAHRLADTIRTELAPIRL